MPCRLAFDTGRLRLLDRPPSRTMTTEFGPERVDTLKIRDAKDVEDAVRAAVASEQPLEIVGHGSKRLIGQPMATNALLDLSALNAVVAYEPNELIITVQAGAPLADVLSLIDSKNQQFAFEPMNTSALLGTPEIGTIGGMIGAGLAGPRRIKAGGARDHLLGAHAVSGFGDSFKAGGKVVKNVTGYDLCKLLAGSWGTLAVMTEVTLKVMPRPESERTLLLRGLDDVDREPGDDGGAGLAFRRVGRRRICRIRRSGPRRARWPAWERQGRRSRCCGWRALRPRRRIARLRWPRCWRRSARRKFWKMRPRRRSGVRSATSCRLRPTARWAPGRCGGSSVRRLPAARSARRCRAIPAAT